MNERFEQMMLEATKDMPQGYYVPGEYFQKFAELIVKECIDIVTPTEHHQVWAQSYLGGVDGLELLDDKVQKVKEHFGIDRYTQEDLDQADKRGVELAKKLRVE